MSFFSNKTVCDQVKFHSINIDPVDAQSDGQLSIANGHIVDSTGKITPVSQIRYEITVDGSSNDLNISAQPGGPNNRIDVLSFNPQDEGMFDFKGHVLSNVGEPSQPTDVATKQYVHEAIADISNSNLEVLKTDIGSGLVSYKLGNLTILNTDIVAGNGLVMTRSETNTSMRLDVSGQLLNITTAPNSGLSATTTGTNTVITSQFIAGNAISITPNTTSKTLRFDVSSGVIATSNGSGLISSTSGSTTTINTSFVAGNGVSITRDNASKNLRFDISAGVIQTGNGSGLTASVNGNITTLATNFVAGSGISIAPVSGSTAIKLSAVGSGLPVGSVIGWITAVAPNGWLLCDGSPISRTTYAELFSVLGTTYGSGNGSSTFNLPNMTGKVARGSGPGFTLGTSGGSDAVTLNANQVPSHIHPISDPGHVHHITDPGHYHDISDNGHSHTSSSVNSTSGSGRIYSADNTSFGPAIPTSTNTTGIAIESAYTNIVGTDSAFTGINATLGNSSTGDAVSLTNPYTVLNYIIKYAS